MKFSKITAIIPDLALSKVEENLTNLGVERFFFCSERCLARFNKEPDKYVRV